MLVYHGSDTIVDCPKILSVNRPLDFGGGFYTTTSLQQAVGWATKVALRNISNDKCINKYEFDLSSAKIALNVLVFEKADEKWLEFICKNRQGLPCGDYDIAIGPVADDKVYRVVVNYENGDVDKETALKRLKTEKLADQVLFHTPASLKYLKYLETEVSADE